MQQIRRPWCIHCHTSPLFLHKTNDYISEKMYNQAKTILIGLSNPRRSSGHIALFTGLCSFFPVSLCHASSITMDTQMNKEHWFVNVSFTRLLKYQLQQTTDT